jgi:hypothetical protein
MPNENLFKSEEKYLQKKKIMTSRLQFKDFLIKSGNKIKNNLIQENIDLKLHKNDKFHKSIGN